MWIVLGGLHLNTVTFMLGELANGSPKAGDNEGNRLLINYHENLRKFKIMLLPIHTTPPAPKKKNPCDEYIWTSKKLGKFMHKLTCASDKGSNCCVM